MRKKLTAFGPSNNVGVPSFVTLIVNAASFVCRGLYPNHPAFTGGRAYTWGVKTVLVVDDDTLIRRLVHDALTKRGGYAVLEAEDGVDGVARFLLHRPDILITDISMPNSDGLEMLDVLKKGKLLEGVRVVIMSGVLNTETLRAKNTGAAALLSKPFNLQELYDAIGG